MTVILTFSCQELVSELEGKKGHLSVTELPFLPYTQTISPAGLASSEALIRLRDLGA